jgi:hypothetical protein|tara:strand:+ start:19580 stop:20146 length:567 start_codon:yes stop_codon:yes gene_type:complete
MRVYEYEDYDDYVEAQTWTNKEKLTWRYVKPHTIKRICEHKPYAAFIICHGTRNGTEQEYFKDNCPNAYIIGTEISETATQFPMTLHHDFTFPVEKWIGKADIIYSNSFDHTIDPEKTITTWRDQLNPQGKIFLEYSERSSRGHRQDPLDATNKEISSLIGDNGMIVEEVWRDGIQHGGVIFICGMAK